MKKNKYSVSLVFTKQEQTRIQHNLKVLITSAVSEEETNGYSLYLRAVIKIDK